MKQKNDYEEDNKITMIYKIPKNQKFIKIFGIEFVKNNKNICKIVVDDKIYELQEKFDINNNNKKDNINIVLNGINNSSNLSCMFSGCTTLISLPDIDKIKIENVIDINNMLYECSSLSSLPDISKWNTKNVKDISSMLQGCSSLQSLPDISGWDTSNLSKMSNLFKGCSSLVSLPDISKWKTDKVDDLCGLFYDCSSLKSLPDISKWKTDKVKDLCGTFYGCSSLTSLPDISKWVTDNVEDMCEIFFRCTSLLSLPDISKWNISKVKNMSFMFYHCSSLVEMPDISQWNTVNAEDMSNMFYGCSSLNIFPEDLEWDISSVTNLSYMFYDCSSLLSLPDISDWDTSNVTDMSYMFCGCTSLTSIPDISEWDTSKVNDKSCMFEEYILSGNITIKSKKKRKKIEKEKMQKMKEELLKQEKEMREGKNSREESFTFNNVLENMCIYGNIMKNDLKEEKKQNPDNFINIEEALKNEEKDKELFALALLSNCLQNDGIETAIKKENNESKEDEEEELVSLQYLSNGLSHKTKYELHFDFGEKKNEDLLENKTEYEKFKSNLIKKLCKDYNISSDEIIVTFPQKGSLKVQVIFQSDELNNLSLEEFKDKFKDDPELKNLKEIHSDLLCGACKFGKKCLDPEGNRVDGWGVGEKRGNKPYDPPIGWIGIGLKVMDVYEDNTWIGMDNSEGEWCVAYHGVGDGQESNQVKKATKSIVKGQKFFNDRGIQYHKNCEDRFHPGKKVGMGAYCTPKIKKAEDYAGISEINGAKYKTVLMVRVNPDKIRACKCEEGDYWVTDGIIDQIRPYRILYKKA